MQDLACVLAPFVALAVALSGCTPAESTTGTPARPTTDAPAASPLRAEATTDAPAASPPSAAGPPPSAEELWKEYKQAFFAKSADQMSQLFLYPDTPRFDAVCYWTPSPNETVRTCSKIPLATYWRSLFANITGAVVVHHESLYRNPQSHPYWAATLVWSSPESGINYQVDSFVIQGWDVNPSFTEHYAYQLPLDARTVMRQATSDTGFSHEPCYEKHLWGIRQQNLQKTLTALGGDPTVVLYDHTTRSTTVARTAEDARQLFTTLFAKVFGDFMGEFSFAVIPRHQNAMMQFAQVHVVSSALNIQCGSGRMGHIGILIISVF